MSISDLADLSMTLHVVMPVNFLEATCKLFKMLQGCSTVAVPEVLALTGREILRWRVRSHKIRGECYNGSPSEQLVRHLFGKGGAVQRPVAEFIVCKSGGRLTVPQGELLSQKSLRHFVSKRCVTVA